MNKHLSAIFCMVIAIGIALTGCSNLPESQDPSSSVNNAMSSQVNQAADGENSPNRISGSIWRRGNTIHDAAGKQQHR